MHRCRLLGADRAKHDYRTRRTSTQSHIIGHLKEEIRKKIKTTTRKDENSEKSQGRSLEKKTKRKVFGEHPKTDVCCTGYGSRCSAGRRIDPMSARIRQSLRRCHSTLSLMRSPNSLPMIALNLELPKSKVDTTRSRSVSGENGYSRTLWLGRTLSKIRKPRTHRSSHLSPVRSASSHDENIGLISGSNTPVIPCGKQTITKLFECWEIFCKHGQPSGSGSRSR